MGFWTGIKHALNSTLGTEDFKPLDKMLDVKVQTVTFSFPATSDETYTANAEIEEIDTSKTIILQDVSSKFLLITGLYGLSFSFSSNSLISCTMTKSANVKNEKFYYTIQLLTFNANVEQS